MVVIEMSQVYVTLQNSINSDGLWYPSISIYYSGCDKPIKCIDCHNPELQCQGIGYKTTNDQLIQDIEKVLIQWLDTYQTISICYLGGEPLAKWNRQSVFEVSQYFKSKYKKQVCNIIYSWRYIDDLHALPMLQYLTYMDYGVLGDFQLENRDTNYVPSSTNQYIYDFRNAKKIQPIRKDI